MNRLFLYFFTLKELKPIQIYYRLYYFIRNRFFKKDYNKELSSKDVSLEWSHFIFHPNSYFGNNKFSFLNLSKDFKTEIDWNTTLYGKLWTYNLNYFDFLNQNAIEVNVALGLIKNYLSKDRILKDGKEPYPISLRGINWIKFLAKNKVSDQEIDQTLYNHFQILSHNLEYHLLGNHLLENGFSLLFGSYYFKEEFFYKKAVEILKSELEEQILNDGGHFELSPMYHQIILFRLLDSIQLIKLNSWKKDDLFIFLEEKAFQMLSWLNKVTFKNGDIPMVNDSSHGIAPSTKELIVYGKELGIQLGNIDLDESGYRMFKKNRFELFVDVGNVGPTYQPGHVHSDTFNFILYINENPIFVDTGVSTYEKNELRQKERSTTSHNTVQIEDIEQTQVWGGFRVAKRAEVIELKEDNFLQATHNGYKFLGIEHTRKFQIEGDVIRIEDEITNGNAYKLVAFFHLHPTIENVSIENSKVLISDQRIELFFKGESVVIEKGSYRFATGFNKTQEGIKLKVLFKTHLETIIQT